MIQTTIRDVLKKSIDMTDHRLYVVEDQSGKVLYVGQSIDCARRLRDHISTRTQKYSYGSLLGGAIYENKPSSDSWPMRLYTVGDCSDIIVKYFPSAWNAGLITENNSLKYAEDALIHEYNPTCNRRVNDMSMLSIPSPFLHQKGVERKEREQQAEEEEAKKKAYLLSGVCDICGEHEKWVDNDGNPGGLMERRHGFTLLCCDCEQIIILLNRLSDQRNAERIRTVRRALRQKSSVRTR